MKKLIKLLFISLLLFITPVKAQEKIHLYLFYSNTCPHCTSEMVFLNQEFKDDPLVEVFYYEVGEKDNQVLFIEASDLLGTPAQSVPYLVIGEEVIVGYLEGYTDEMIINSVNNLKSGTYYDPLGKLSTTLSEDIKIDFGSNTNNNDRNESYNLPILGEVDAKNVSLGLLSVVMGLVDGFNPCAMWVLVFLITMLIGMRDRKKMWILGLSFIFTSGIVYYLFMFAWLNMAQVLAQIKIIQSIIALVALGFGLYSIYSFYKAFKNDGCEVIDEKRRHKIMSRIKDISETQKLSLAVLSIIVLAVMINLFELMCSLGLPVVFTQILSVNNLNPLQNQFYLWIYILFFLIDDLIIFALAMFTLKIKPISQRYLKFSHLIGGIIMIVIGLLMAFKPEYLMLNL